MIKNKLNILGFILFSSIINMSFAADVEFSIQNVVRDVNTCHANACSHADVSTSLPDNYYSEYPVEGPCINTSTCTGGTCGANADCSDGQCSDTECGACGGVNTPNVWGGETGFTDYTTQATCEAAGPFSCIGAIGGVYNSLSQPTDSTTCVDPAGDGSGTAGTWGPDYIWIGGTLDIHITNTVNVAGFQLELLGITILRVGGGLAATYLQSTSSSYNHTTESYVIVGFSTSGGFIPPIICTGGACGADDDVCSDGVCNDTECEACGGANTSTVDVVLVQVDFANYTNLGICFGTDTDYNVASDTNANAIAGTEFGTCYCHGTMDTCGICDEDSNNDNAPSTGICDCNSTPSGSAYTDNCSVCVSGTTNATACTPDCTTQTMYDADNSTCTGTWIGTSSSCYGGSLTLDACMVCDGSNTTGCAAPNGTPEANCDTYCDCDGNIDADTDGVCDGDDDCLETAAGAEVDTDGCSQDQLSISQIGSAFPNEFSISQNYPNPFNPVTNITFDVVDMDEISLVVYDLSGKEVVTLASGKFMPGRYSVNWDAVNNYGDAIASGMYVYRYISGEKAITRKMLYLK